MPFLSGEEWVSGRKETNLEGKEGRGEELLTGSIERARERERKKDETGKGSQKVRQEQNTRLLLDSVGVCCFAVLSALRWNLLARSRSATPCFVPYDPLYELYTRE